MLDDICWQQFFRCFLQETSSKAFCWQSCWWSVYGEEACTWLRAGGLYLSELQKATAHVKIGTEILQRPKCLCILGPAKSASDCSGIICVNEVTSVCRIGSIFRMCTICTSVTDLRSFVSNLVLLLASESSAFRGDFVGCFKLFNLLRIDHLPTVGLPVLAGFSLGGSYWQLY